MTENTLTPLDERIKEIAASDFTMFCQLVGEAAIVRAKVCILIGDGKSQVQIARKLSITRRKIQGMGCKVC